MAAKWKTILRQGVPEDTHVRHRFEKDPIGNTILVLERLIPEEVDITQELTVKLTKSHLSDGYYCDIRHGDKSVMVLGIPEASKGIVREVYRLAKAEGAEVSFRVYLRD